MNFYRRFRDAVICIALLALPFFVLRANLKDPAKTSALDRAILEGSAPIQLFATRLAQSVSGVLQEYVYLVDVGRENDRLREENAQLREANYKLTSEASENRRLRRLLQLRDELRGSLLSAQVIGKEVSPFFRVMRIVLDRGERDRVKAGMPVVTAEGLVGQIRRTFGRYADVLLTADKTSAIDVVVQRNGARGMLRGVGSEEDYACQLEQLSRDDDVKPGDLVVTSGLGQRFPPSILVGRIKTVSKPQYGLYQEATVEPAVHFSRLEEVLIMTAGSRASGIVDPTTTSSRSER
ncbi:MAG TPA: rod shape-determining protein MreC [Polyangiales bacterium]|jgi:rod shape-determining protein MreC|nr:rod shape-determining protein MreC [Polyangiales bacterium]